MFVGTTKALQTELSSNLKILPNVRAFNSNSKPLNRQLDLNTWAKKYYNFLIVVSIQINEIYNKYIDIYNILSILKHKTNLSFK